MRGSASYTWAMIKKLLFLALLGYGAWYLMGKMRDNAMVQQVTKEPEKYVGALQNDVKRAQDAADKASKVINQKNADAEKAVDAAQ
jgi:hypothetical protein